ncbi:SVOP [Symbiodinium sp. CCMP2592]|nr:SVOP [Symbiodinium sp. CCMP2592]
MGAGSAKYTKCERAVEQECCERCGKSYMTTLEITYEIEKVRESLQCRSCHGLGRSSQSGDVCKACDGVGRIASQREERSRLSHREVDVEPHKCSEMPVPVFSSVLNLAAEVMHKKKNVGITDCDPAELRAFLLSSLIITTFGFLTALCQGFYSLIIMRAIVGVGVAGLPVGFDILAEAMPSSGRGKFGFYMEFFWTAGSLYVVLMAWLLLEQLGWQLFTAAAALPTLVASFAGYMSLPESPRWLVDMDRETEALAIVKSWAKSNGVEMRHQQLIKSSHHTDNVSVLDLFRRSALRWKTFAHSLVWFAFGVNYYGIVMLLPRIFQKGVESGDVARSCKLDFDNQDLLISSSAEIVGLLLGIWLIDDPGRVFTQGLFYTITGVCSFLLGFRSLGLQFLTVVASVGRLGAMAASSSTWVQCPELFPTAVRGEAHSLMNLSSKIGAFLAPFAISDLFTQWQSATIMAVVAMMGAAMALTLPETSGEELSAVSEAEIRAVDISWLTAPPKTARALRQLGESKSLQEAIRRDEQERQAAQTQRAVAEAAATAKQALVKAEEGARRRDEIVERLAKEIHELKEKLETVASVSPSQAGASAAPTPSSFPAQPASEGFPAFSAWPAADTAPAWPSQSPALVPRQRTRSLSTETPLPASVPQRQRTRSFSNEPPEKPPTAAPRRHRTRSSSKETGQRQPRMQAPRQRTRSFSNDAPPEMPPAPAQRQRTRSLSSEKPQTSAMLRQRSSSIEAATLRPSESMPRQRTLSSSSGGFREQHQDWHIDEERMERYKTVFVRADLDADGFVEMAQARQALQKASLSEDDMGKILTLADTDKDGRFTRGEFVCALHLAYLRSKQAIPLPQQLPPELQALVGAEFSWAAKPEEMAQYHETFQQLDSHGTGIIGASEGRELFEMSGLPVAELSHIWQLCDMDRDGSLTFVEFACAMAIVARRRRGGPVPSEVPIALQRAAAEFAPSGPSEAELDGYRRHYRQLDPSQSGRADIAATKEFFEASGLPIAELSAIYAMADLDHDGQLSEPEFLCAMALVTRRKSGAAIPEALPSSVQQACFAAVGPESSVPETQATQGSWQATSEELERYRELFSQLRDAHGFVGAGDAREVLESSGLPLDDLAVIWDLADAGDDGQLDEGEFICAMVLAMRRRAGTPLPSALPPELAASSRPAGFDQDELLMYLDMFGKQVPQGGHMSADLAREILESSNLPTTDLSLIWRLCASSASGLTAPEFLAAMVLARQRRQGLALPSSLPSPLAASATAVSAAQGYPT